MTPFHGKTGARIKRLRPACKRAASPAFPLIALLLTACATAPPPTAEPEDCRERLALHDVDFEPAPNFSSGGCHVSNAVKVSRVGHAKLSSPALMTCALALKLSEFEAVFVQPTAIRVLHSPITTIHHYGTYACRRRTSGTRMSEHAKANAIDIGVFETATGNKVSVTRHWNTHDAKAEFLKTVGQGACTLFMGVLGPDSDKAHHDHFHFDMGDYAFCQLKFTDPRKR
ncbi:MAG: extensin family protein [Rhodospirillaceae bacterium]|nr:extensin family protein [Rhodospirillaceae bacterium]